MDLQCGVDCIVQSFIQWFGCNAKHAPEVFEGISSKCFWEHMIECVIEGEGELIIFKL